MNKRVYLITGSYPYLPGEQFLETEVKYWANQDDLKLIILPLTCGNGRKRDVPDNVKVDLSLVNKLSNGLLIKIIYLFNALRFKIFYRELFYKVFPNPARLMVYLMSIIAFEKYYKLFDIYLKRLGKNDDIVFYTYRHSEATYALQLLKKEYNFILISRIHGWDIYQERRILNYMPLKRLFLENIDKIYTITDSAQDYLVSTYGFSKKIMETYRLGVDDKEIISLPTSNGHLHLVSCSYIVEGKRLDKIIDAIVLASADSSLYIKWSHIGTGILEHQIKEYAEAKLNNRRNISCVFLGELPNNDVYEFYKNTRIDVFINVSEYEGVPVSIMEAMSCHIPVIAPDIGGVSDMVRDGYNGIMLSTKAEVIEIVNALNKVDFFKNKNIRENAYRTFLSKYSAKNNYTEFLKSITTINGK